MSDVRWDWSKGRWAVHPHSSGTIVEEIRPDTGRRIVATAASAGNDDEARAIAKLIAAAPEMADALIVALKFLDHTQKPAIAKVRAALAKAGVTP